MSILIYGCGGESIKNNSNIEQSVNKVDIESHDVQKKALKNDTTQINVGATTDSDAELIISKQVLLNHNSDCVLNDVDGLNMNISSNSIGECRYEYTVTPKNESLYDGESKSIVRVSISETAQENTLTSINKETNLDTEVVIDIEEELNEEITGTDYHIIDDVTVIGSGSANADEVENTITYVPEFIGITEIMYTMSDGENILLGSIYVSVSDSENTPPVANNYVKKGVITKGTMIEIDLSDVISDKEDPVILDTVKAYNANVSITSSTDHTFTFESEIPGGHEVTYTISDSRGGYAVAQVYIEVEPDFSLIQDWEDITVYDPYIDSDITFTAPMSKVMADYTNTSYVNTVIEEGTSGPKGAEIVTMTKFNAKNHCETRGGRLPLLRELKLIAKENIFQSDNWPASISYWSANNNSILSAYVVDLLTYQESVSNTENYVTCVLLNDEVKDFSLVSFEERVVDGVDNSFNTTRYLDAKIVDPDGNLSPYSPVSFKSTKESGGFGQYNNNYDKVSYSNENGIASAIYEFTSDYSDNVISYINSSNAEVISVNLNKSGFDVTNPDDWNVAKIYGDVDLDSYEPIISEDGTKFSLGDAQQYMTSISKTSLIGNEIIVIFGVDRSQATNLAAGNSNIIFQQVSSKAPDINSECDINIYGDCSWSSSNKDTAGFPTTDDRWFGFMFNYYSQTIQLKDSSGALISSALKNRGNTQLYYKISIENGFVKIYQNTTENFENIKPDISYNIEKIKVDTSKFYYFGLSGGAHGNAGVFGDINYLNIF